MAEIERSYNERGNVHLCLLALCFLLIFCCASQANELVNLDLHDQVYGFIKRLTAKNLIEKRLDNTQPLSRREAAETLIEIAEKHQAGQIELTDVEKKHLERFQWLFADGINELKPDFLPPVKKVHTVAIKGENYNGDFDLSVKQEIAIAKPSSEVQQNTSISSIVMALRAKLGQRVGISSIVHTRLLLGSAAYSPYQGELTFSYSDALGSDACTLSSMEGYIVLDLSWLSIQWGLDNIWWGPGWRGALLLSDNSAPKDTLKLSGTCGPVKYTYLTAILRENRGDEYYPKYMSAHRLEVLPCKGISIGVNEVMVFIERYEPRYLNPLIALMISQVENLTSNLLLGFDVDVALIPSVELYAELMVDDFQSAEGLVDSLRLWSSKYGILLGGYWVDPFRLRDADVRIEYAFVNQYAYTSTYEGFHSSHTHQGRVIGHWMGTDADDLCVDMRRWLTDKLRISLTYERERQGEGDVEKRYPFVRPSERQPGYVEPHEYWEFLSGTVQSTHSFSMGLSRVSIGRSSTGLEYTYSYVRNVDHEPEADGQKHQVVMRAEYRF